MTPKQQAEQMARKCAECFIDMASKREPPETRPELITIIAKEITDSLPLEELLEVARAGAKACEGYMVGLKNTDHGKGNLNHLADALTNLRNKGVEI